MKKRYIVRYILYNIKNDKKQLILKCFLKKIIQEINSRRLPAHKEILPMMAPGRLAFTRGIIYNNLCICFYLIRVNKDKVE